jgi:outer membrane protein assembly factor BamB/orotate phosphoribosyltransferase
MDPSHLETLRRAVLGGIVWTKKRGFLVDNRASLSDRNILHIAAQAIVELIQDKNLEVDAIGCSGLGGTPLATAVSLLLPHPVKLVQVRKESKGYDLNKMVECSDLKPGTRLWIIDDLLNGGRCFRLIEQQVLKAYPGVRIMGIITLGAMNKRGKRYLEMRRVEHHHLFNIHDDLKMTRVLPAPTQDRFERVWQNVSVCPSTRPIRRSFPAVVGDKLIVGTDQTGWIACDKYTGEIIWELQSSKKNGKSVAPQPQLYDGRLYLAAYDGVVRCVNPDTGSIYWQNKTDSFIHSTPAFHDGRLYLGTEGRKRRDHWGDFVCMDAKTGLEYWRVPTMDQVPCSPCVVPEHQKAILGSNDMGLYCADMQTGELSWKIDTGQLIKGFPTYARDRVYTCSNEGILDCRSIHDGSLVWSRKLGSSLHHDRPIHHDGKIIVSLHRAEYTMAALDENTGEVVWYNLQKSKHSWGPTLHDDQIYCPLWSGDLVKIDANTGHTVWCEHLVDNVNLEAPVVLDFPQIYILSAGAGLICYKYLEV